MGMLIWILCNFCSDFVFWLRVLVFVKINLNEEYNFITFTIFSESALNLILTTKTASPCTRRPRRWPSSWRPPRRPARNRAGTSAKTWPTRSLRMNQPSRILDSTLMIGNVLNLTILIKKYNYHKTTSIKNEALGNNFWKTDSDVVNI